MRWNPELLQQLRDDPEIELVLRRTGHADLRLPVWVVVVDDQAYVRSWKGRGSRWFGRAQADPDQAIEVRGTTVVARFVPVASQSRAEVDAAYLGKYAGYPDSATAMTTDVAAETTMRIEPLT